MPAVLGSGLTHTTVDEGLQELIIESGLTDVTVLNQDPVLDAPVLAQAVWS